MRRSLLLQGATEHANSFDQLALTLSLTGDDPDDILHVSKISAQRIFAGYLSPWAGLILQYLFPPAAGAPPLLHQRKAAVDVLTPFQ
ncbi:uncharacterized protein GGS25DRAFT_488186 [Hypoxylon fragiforme]|uniref:uncharacterized protein n=1 Tax=Hypoxylon fragiforme TaxID=63214 RepID=UPI0020C70E99|nr:uncharacterized protein GGS25DRAFT_488186 [Hypoxylon fragiforme]KAI2610261.1 hypothetical protein GGS25DRAFT_488186 [Hypoxylon fragiforme]